MSDMEKQMQDFMQQERNKSELNPTPFVLFYSDRARPRFTTLTQLTPSRPPIPRSKPSSPQPNPPPSRSRARPPSNPTTTLENAPPGREMQRILTESDESASKPSDWPASFRTSSEPRRTRSGISRSRPGTRRGGLRRRSRPSRRRLGSKGRG